METKSPIPIGASARRNPPRAPVVEKSPTPHPTPPTEPWALPTHQRNVVASSKIISRPRAPQPSRRPPPRPPSAAHPGRSVASDRRIPHSNAVPRAISGPQPAPACLLLFPFLVTWTAATGTGTGAGRTDRSIAPGTRPLCESYLRVASRAGRCRETHPPNAFCWLHAV